jgi:TP901 family phage tail tape measure protein
MAANLTMQIAIGAALAGSFSTAFPTAGCLWGETQKRLEGLSKATGNIGNYQKLQQKITSNQAAMLAMRKEAGNLSASSLPEARKQAESLAAKADVLQKRLDKDREALSRLRPELHSAGVDTKNLDSEQARLAEKSAKLTQAQERLASSQAAADASRQTLASAKGDLMASAGWILAMKAPIQTAANFEQAMAKVGAVSGATSEDMAKDMARLTEQARILGRDTQFTATQAANSQEMLARANFKTEEIIKTMPGLLNMAAAEGMDLATAADIAASTLRGFQLAADQSNRVADVLAKTSAASNTSISGLGESMKMVAPIAAGLSIPFEETAAMIGVMGDAGIKGSEAGTALRASLIRLSKEPTQTHEALEKLGVATRDAKGNLRTIPSLMQSLSDKMKGMGDADKMGELSKIFGTEAASGMLAVMDTAQSGRLQKLTETLQNAGGAAAEMAAKMNDTAQGAMKRLGSAWESLNIDIGNSVLPTFTGMVEKLAGAISWLSDKAQKFPMVTSALTGFFVAVGLYKVAATAGKVLKAAFMLPFQDIAVGVNKVRAAYALADGSVLKMIKSTKLFTTVQGILNAVMSANPILLVVLAVTALAGALMYAYYKCEWFREAVDLAWETMKVGFSVWYEWGKKVFAWFMAGVDEIIAFFSSAAEVFGGILSGIQADFQSAFDFIASIFGGFREKWDSLVTMFRDSPIGNLIASISDKFTAGFEKITGVIEKVSGIWNKFKSALGMAPKIPVPEGQPVQIGRRGGNGVIAAERARKHAAGGIFSRPHLGLVAERGTTESIIPHSPIHVRRERA